MSVEIVDVINESDQVIGQKSRLEVTSADKLRYVQIYLFDETGKIIDESPEFIKVFYNKDELVSKPGDKVSVKLFKFRKRTWASLTGKPIAVKIPLRELISYHLPGKMRIALYLLLKAYGKSGFKKISGFQAMFLYMKKSFNTIEESLIRGDYSHKLLEKEKNNALDLIVKCCADSSKSKFKRPKKKQAQNTNNKSIANEIIINDVEEEDGSGSEQFHDLSGIKIPPELAAIIGDSLKQTIGLISEDIGRVDINGLMRRRQQMQINSGEKLRKKIAEIPNNWYRNQTLFFNAALMDLLLQTAQNNLGIVVQKVMSKIKDTYHQNVLENLEKDHNRLQEFVTQINEDPFAEFKNSRTDWGYARDKVFYKEINDKLLVDIKETINLFPDSIEIMGEPRPGKGKRSLDLFEEKQYEKVESISISLNRLLNYLIQTHLSEPIRQQLNTVPEKFEKTISIADDVIRLISFSLNNPDRDFSTNGTSGGGQLIDEKSKGESKESQEEGDLKTSIIDFVNEGDARIKNEISRTKEQKRRTLNKISDALNKTIDSLEPDVIIASAGNLKDYIKKSKKRRSVSDWIKEVKPGLRKKTAKIWYRKSESLLAARKLSISSGRLSISAALWKGDEDEGELRLDEFLNIVEDVSPNHKVLDNLPFYYRQLFLGKQNVDRAFWTGRKQALADAKKAILRFRRGLTRDDMFSVGGLLILGEQNSGKTYLSQYISGRYFNKKKIIQINAPDSGSIDINVFGNAVKRAINTEEALTDGANLKSLKDVEKDSVFIFNDLELWWERSNEGAKVVEQIADIINKYGGKFFFIVNANIHSFRYINKIIPFSNSFQKMLDCEPFNAEELKDIILFRHKSTGIKYRLNKRREDDVSGWRQARLFSKHFNYSKGNVGVALNSWVNSIKIVSLSERSADLSVSKGTGIVHIIEPKTPNLNRLKYMSTDWMLILIQFILHKRITLSKLIRISAINSDKISNHIDSLVRARVIVLFTVGKNRLRNENLKESQEMEPVYELNPFLRPHIVNDMVERGVL